jgi:hypothetical protein
MASHRLSFVVSTAVIASPMQRQASSYLPSSAYARAKHDNHHGIKTVAPVDRHAVIPIDFLLAHDYELSRRDADSIGRAVSQFLSDSALFTTSART